MEADRRPPPFWRDTSAVNWFYLLWKTFLQSFFCEHVPEMFAGLDHEGETAGRTSNS